MKSFNKMIALLLLAVSFSAGASFTKSEFFAADEQAQTQMITALFAELRGNSFEKMAELTGVGTEGIFYGFYNDDTQVFDAAKAVEYIRANSGFFANAKRTIGDVVNSNAFKYGAGVVGAGLVVGAGIKYGKQIENAALCTYVETVKGFHNLHEKLTHSKAKAEAARKAARNAKIKKYAIGTTIAATTIGGTLGGVNYFAPHVFHAAKLFVTPLVTPLAKKLAASVLLTKATKAISNKWANLPDLFTPSDEKVPGFHVDGVKEYLNNMRPFNPSATTTETATV